MLIENVQPSLALTLGSANELWMMPEMDSTPSSRKDRWSPSIT